jgi:hypothetical protein
MPRATGAHRKCVAAFGRSGWLAETEGQGVGAGILAYEAPLVFREEVFSESADGV